MNVVIFCQLILKLNGSILQCEGVLKVQSALIAHKASRFCVQKKLISTFNRCFFLFFWFISALLNFLVPKYLYLIVMKDCSFYSHFMYFGTKIKVTNNVLSCKCHKSVTFAQVVLRATIFHSHLLGLSHQFLEKGKNSIKFIQLFCLALYRMYFSEYPLFLLVPNYLDRPGSSVLSAHFGRRPPSGSSGAALVVGWEDAALRAWFHFWKRRNDTGLPH